MSYKDVFINEKNEDALPVQRLRLRYPEICGDDKCAERINKTIEKIISEYKAAALRDKVYTYHDLKYRVKSTEPFSVLFENTKKGPDSAFSYRVFSITFDKNGRAAPLDLEKTNKKAAKKYFRSYGIKLYRKALRFSYYIENGKFVIYAIKPGRGKMPELIVYDAGISPASASGRLFR